MLRLITHSRAAKRPLAASLSHTRVGPQALPDRFHVSSAGLRTTMRCFQLLAGKQRIHSALQATPMHVLKVLSDIFCHEKDCNSRIYGGVSHFPHINLQSRQDTSSPNLRYLRIVKINTSTKLDFDQTPGRRGQQEATRPEGIVQDTVKMSAGQRALLPHLILTRASRPRPHRLSFGADRARQPKRPRDQSDNVGKASKDSTWFTPDY